jgi:hypothetical protein
LRSGSELLQEKYPAAVWHLLDALKRFENLDARRVAAITFEVARLGESLSRSTEISSCPPRYHRPLRLVFSFQLSSFSIFLRASCMPDSNASLPIRMQAWI